MMFLAARKALNIDVLPTIILSHAVIKNAGHCPRRTLTVMHEDILFSQILYWLHHYLSFYFFTLLMYGIFVSLWRLCSKNEISRRRQNRFEEIENISQGWFNGSRSCFIIIGIVLVTAFGFDYIKLYSWCVWEVTLINKYVWQYWVLDAGTEIVIGVTASIYFQNSIDWLFDFPTSLMVKSLIKSAREDETSTWWLACHWRRECRRYMAYSEMPGEMRPRCPWPRWLDMSSLLEAI